MPTKENIDAFVAFSQAVSEDLVLLSALHAKELEPQMLIDLKLLGFPAGLGLRLNSSRADTVLNHLSRAVKQWPDEVDSSCLDELAADYAAIYLNAQLGASPYESFWLDEERLVMQKPMFEVRECYREQGMRVENWRSRADDHIVNELNFLAEMIRNHTEPDKLSIAADFLDEHLLRWVDQFAERVANYSESDFYGGLLLLTAVYCHELRDLLAIVLGQPRPSPEEIETRMSKRKPESVHVAPPQFGTGTGPTW